jgi:hypothetical protein
MDKDLKRYIQILRRVQANGEVSSDDLSFFMGYTADVDEEKLKKVTEGGEFTSREDFLGALRQVSTQLQTSPEYKDKILQAAADNQGTKVAEKLSTGLNLLMGASDIAQSVNQINASKEALAKSKRPSRPRVPQRDQYLQQALRSAQEGTFDAQRAMAPVQSQIQDQYQTDISNAQTASAGQSGAFGAYAQLAANRRNKAAMNLAPIADDVRAREQQRYDNLLGLRMNETQNMFDNQASLYPYDLQQYQNEQEAAASLGATGRSNLRNSMFGVASQIPGAVGNQVSRNRYRNLYNQMSAYGDDVANSAVRAKEKLYGYLGSDDSITPEMF